MVIYHIELATPVVDGSQYTANDTIIIRAGKRGNLTFKNFNGAGLYIPITNENTNTNSKVEINGALQLDNCKYVDLRGDNNSDLTYGIKVINDGIPQATANSVHVMGKSDHIKTSYIEVAFDGNTTSIGIGIILGDGTESSSWTFDTIEIHHNYIYGSRYSGMYLGGNDPKDENNPYIANVSVHDNIIDDAGAYGMCLKGVAASSGICYIYNNIIRVTGLVWDEPRKQVGISVHTFYGDTAYAKIFNNRVEHTKGTGIRAGKARHQIYNNEVLGCGTGNDSDWGHGIVAYYLADDINIYDNIIIQPTRYGIYALSGAGMNSTTISRNLIGDAGLGGWGEESSGRIIVSSGPDANIYHDDVDDFGFKRWSDDGDYSNDDFTIGDPCEGVVCDNICIGKDLWSQKCVEGDCVPDQLLESNSASCGYDPCEGVFCDNICIGLDLWSQNCVDGSCVPDQLLESNSASCGYDPCEGVVCDNICIGLDLWSQKCEGGSCVPDQLLESNSVTCELCEGVVCGNTCVGDDLWSQRCDPDTGNCVPNQLIQQNSINCKIPDQVPSDESTIKTYIMIGGLGIMGLAMLMLRKK